MAKVLLHIGSPKTGSSAMQRMLSDKRDALESAGIQLPCADIVLADSPLDSGNGEWLANLCTGIWPMDTAKGQSALRVLKEQLTGRRDALLSSENFYYATDEALAVVGPILRQAYEEVGIVLYLRNPVDMCFSLWLQGVKRDFVAPVALEDFAQDFSFDPMAVIERFERAFLFPKLYIRNYDALGLRAVDDLCSTMESFFGVALDGMASQAIQGASPAGTSLVNRSLYRPEVVFMQTLTQALASARIPQEKVLEAKRLASDAFIGLNQHPEPPVCPAPIAERISQRAGAAVDALNGAHRLGLQAQSTATRNDEDAANPYEGLLRAAAAVASNALSRVPPALPVVYLRDGDQFQFDGYVDHASSVYVSGWVVCTTFPESCVLVLIKVGTTEITLVANMLRTDVAAANPGYSPYCGYYYEFDAETAAAITRGEPVNVSVLGSPDNQLLAT